MKDLRKYHLRILIFILLLGANDAYSQTDVSASKALVQRILPNHFQQFSIEMLNGNNGKDWFDIESSNNKIILRGTSGVAVASALYYYLNQFATHKLHGMEPI
jgi:alpha-N-acetylglucosaminidase